MLNFCTLFDINFINQGLAMYKSLLDNCGDFTLYIFAFCDESYKLLSELNLKNVKVISLNELEQGIPDLLKAKPTRTKGEYCWTCACATILYCLQKFNLENCTYIDADLYFFANPKVLINEVENDAILLTEHRYTPCYDQTKTSGKYCVQFAYFKNNQLGLKALNWWVNSCIEWCFNRCEDGKFGDQKYLDDWTTRFEGVHVLKHLGGGVAPWNVQQYEIYKKNNKLFVKDSLQNVPIVFYHFHDIKAIDGKLIENEGYVKNKIVKKLLYKPYIQNLIKTSVFLHKKNKKIKVLKQINKPILKQLKNIRKSIIKIKFGKNGYLTIFNKEVIKL